MSRDHETRMASFCFAYDQAGLDEAVETAFRAGIDWARRHIGPVQRTLGALYRSEVQEVAAELGTTPEALWEHTRTPAMVRARVLAMWLLRHRHGFSYPAIGRALRRDHSSAIHGVAKVDGSAELLARATELLGERAA